MAERTRVYFTVDIEGAEERRHADGRIQPPLGYDLRIWGRFANQKRELGIALIMEALEAHGMRGTFFTEVFGAAYFGEPGLREVCEALRGRGHDVQLHTHPIQRTPEWRSKGIPEPPDDMHAFSVEEQAALLRQGVAILDRCGVPAPEVLAFRAGNFGASNEIWEAMRLAGLRVSSNYNPCYLGKACRMHLPEHVNALFETSQAGVWELPISNFRAPGGGFRHLQITAVSQEEATEYLRRARAMGIPEVTLVTHSFEYFWVDSVQQRLGRPNAINANRLRGICRWLADRSRDFEVETVGGLARRLPFERPARITAFPTGSRLWMLKRLVEQGYKRFEARRSEQAAKA